MCVEIVGIGDECGIVAGFVVVVGDGDFIDFVVRVFFGDGVVVVFLLGVIVGIVDLCDWYVVYFEMGCVYLCDFVVVGSGVVEVDDVGYGGFFLSRVRVEVGLG